jgi:PPP family 3-phenylpropionic acid transporter
VPADRMAFRAGLRGRAVWVALLIAALIAISFGPYYAFYSIYLEASGYARSTIGILWALGVLAEIAVFAYGGPVLARFSIRALLIAAATATAVRWTVIALFPESIALLAAAQLLHCLGFAVLHVAIVLTAQRSFTADAAGRGQALFSSVGYGAGGMLGSLFGGLAWTALSPRATYLGAALVVSIATVCAVFGLRGTALDQADPQTALHPR